MKVRSLIYGLIIASLVAGGTVFYLALNNDNEKIQLDEQQRAIQSAESFTPSSDDCVANETAAIHIATQTEYVFATTCLPTGWESNAPVDPSQLHKSDQPIIEDGIISDDKMEQIPPRDPTHVTRPFDPTRLDLTEDQEQALRDARDYRPDTVCIMVLTPARHIATGAIYTFSNGCIPPGWERISSADVVY